MFTHENAAAGGRARAANLTPERRREIARNAVNARWKGTARPKRIAKAVEVVSAAVSELDLDDMPWKYLAPRLLSTFATAVDTNPNTLLSLPSEPSGE